MVRLVRWTGSRWHLIRDGQTNDLAGFPRDLTVRHDSIELPATRTEAGEFFAARPAMTASMCNVCARAAVRLGLLPTNAIPYNPPRPTSRGPISSVVVSGALQNSARTFGIEIECVAPRDACYVAQELTAAGVDCRNEGYNHTTRTWWKIVSDSSVHGRGYSMEIVSPPMSGAEGLRQTKIVCDVLKRMGVTVNSSCGLHVHHDAHDFRPADFVRVAEFYRRFEGVFDGMMPASRRADRHSLLHSMSRFRTLGSMLSRVGLTMSYLQNEFYDRYFKVNISAFWRHGTIEFRHHGGTINFRKIASWVKMTGAIMEWARGTTDIPAAGLDRDSNATAMFAALNLPEAVRRFAERRAARFAGATV